MSVYEELQKLPRKVRLRMLDNLAEVVDELQGRGLKKSLAHLGLSMYRGSIRPHLSLEGEGRPAVYAVMIGSPTFDGHFLPAGDFVDSFMKQKSKQ